MKLTKEEKQLILDKREKEGYYKPQKVGFLKEDLWYLRQSSPEWSSFVRLSICSVSEKEAILQELNKCFEFLLPVGTKFYCYVDKNVEHWQGPGSDDVFESMTSAWAKRYLINIENI